MHGTGVTLSNCRRHRFWFTLNLDGLERCRRARLVEECFRVLLKSLQAVSAAEVEGFSFVLMPAGSGLWLNGHSTNRIYYRRSVIASGCMMHRFDWFHFFTLATPGAARMVSRILSSLARAKTARHGIGLFNFRSFN